MNATARDFNSLPADTNGFEEIFDCEQVRTGADGCLAPVPTDANLYRESLSAGAELAEPMPVENAAKALGQTLNALKKQLRKGTIKGFKRQTKHGEKWFVDASEIPRICEQVPTSADGCLAPVPAEKDLCLAPVPLDVEVCLAPVPTSADPLHGAPAEPVAADTERLQVDKHLEVIKELQNKIEILTYRNGYLEAQLETEREQIKLLTDSQHQPSWWTKFKSWFMGSP